jgi:hypothetical protein
MQNLTVHLGSTTPFSSRAGPRAPAHHSRLPALAATRARPRRRQRVTVRTATRRPRAPRLDHDRPRQGRGAARRSGPGPMMSSHAVWHSHGRTTPPLPLLFPLCRAADRLFSYHARDARPRSVTDPVLAPPLERRLPPHHFRTRTATSGHRRPLPRVRFH